MKEGVKIGVLGIKKAQEVYYRRDVELRSDSIVLRGEIAEKILAEKRTEVEEKIEKEVEEKKEEVETKREERRPEQLKEERKVAIKRFSLEAEIPLESMHEVISGVIKPLREKSSSIKTSIKIVAESNDGFDRSTLNIKVKETLLQIKAKILDWKED